MMKVELVSYQQAVKPELRIGTLEELVAYVARVSNPSNQMNMETAPKLLKYLINNKHVSPFEMVSICLEIETTRDIGRQILRHRSFSFQEFSQRYAKANLGMEFKPARLQDTKNRQNSLDTTDEGLKQRWINLQKKVADDAMEAYNWALDNGVAKEQARAVLPEGITVTKMYMNGTLRSWIHYIELRTEAGTQKEHRDVAFACAKAIEPIFPLIKEFTHE